jgi:hypothetical protein
LPWSLAPVVALCGAPGLARLTDGSLKCCTVCINCDALAGSGIEWLSVFSDTPFEAAEAELLTAMPWLGRDMVTGEFTLAFRLVDCCPYAGAIKKARYQHSCRESERS